MPEQKIAVTVDCVVFTDHNEKLKVLLIRRGKDPFKDQWALPGGFLEVDESLEAGAKRELEEETGIGIDTVEQVGAFGAVDRDPRGRTISIAFWGLLSSPSSTQAADDAAAAQWFNTAELPQLAFDHGLILKMALEKYHEQK